MSVQQVTPELRKWIVAQATAGCKPEAVLKAMCDSGWNEGVAIDALETTMQGYLDERTRALVLPACCTVPDPDLSEAPISVDVEGHRVRILMTLQQPRVVVFGNLLSADECDELVAQARVRLVRSETVDNRTGGSELNAARTSEGMFFSRGESALVSRFEARIAALLRWPIENGEGLQILRYQPGAEYKPHYDYFDPKQPGTPRILERGGQRVATLVTYLSTPSRGGATTFPDVKLEIAPVKGNAVFFSYDRPHASTHTLHGGAPVLEGEKWVATKWLRQGQFD
jgi:prolyl 4-hydroxylase